MAAAAELFSGPPASFVAERRRRAADARAAGDRDLAARIAALPKPSAAAGLANRLRRDAPDDLARVLQLGADLRAAQEAGDRHRLRELTGERRRLLEQVAADAADREERDGRRPGAAVLEELQQTLQAAMAADEAAAAVRSGRLVRALAADGLEPADLAGAVAPEGTLPPVERVAPSVGAEAPRAQEAGAEPEHDEDEPRRRAEAQQRADAASARAREARQEADDAAAQAAEDEAQAEQRAQSVDRLQARVDELQQRLDRERSALDDACEAAERARAAADDAARAAEQARHDADEAAAQVGWTSSGAFEGRG